MMYDLKKVNEKFHEFLKSGLKEERYNLNEIEITEELLEQQEAIYIPFGYVSYFLVIEDEKPVVYVHAATRMDLDLITFIDENGYESYDVFDDNKDISEKYYSQSRKIKRFTDLKDIRKLDK